jgi:hypothetical protein
MRYRILLLLMLLGVATVAPAQVNIGINFSVFPGLVRVPGYPVYYAPQQAANYFFYDGMYWVYQDDYWYSSSWYNGPWWRADPQYVPEYILRVPVRYYRRPPVYFRGWQGNAPPRWGEHWGNDWEQHRRGWDQWDHKAAPAPAPLPVYQKQYSGTRYPKAEQQQVLQGKNYRYQPKDALVREHFEPKMREAPAPVARDRQPEPQRKNVEPQRKDSEPQRKDSGKDERAQKSGPSNQPEPKSEPAGKKQPTQPQAATPREPAAAPREQPAQKPAVQPQRPQPQAATPREPAAASREQQAPRSADQPQRSQPQAATPREPAAAQREQPAPKAAPQPQRSQPQAAPQREQPAPKAADQPQRSQPRAPANKPDRNEEKAAEKGR